MKRIIRTVTLNALAIYLLSLVAPGLHYSSWVTLFEAALILGFLNAFLRPILSLLTLPINLLTLGLFSLILNIFILFLVTRIVPGLSINAFTLEAPFLGQVYLNQLAALLFLSVSINLFNNFFNYVFS